MSGYGGLRLTQESKAALKGECTVELRKDPPTIARTKGSAQSKGKADRNFSAKREHPSLWEELRQLRLQLARKQGVPPYIIFPDSTLNEMIRQRPTSLADMRNVSGVGEKKLAAYGEAFLNVLAQ